MKKRPLRPDPKAQKRAQEKRDRFKRFVRQIAEMKPEEREAMVADAGLVTCEGHALSMTNTMLTIFQMPSATVVGGFKQWIRNGRCVRKGEQGFMIWVPTATKSESTEDQDVRFLTANVFDISQTEALAEKAAA